MVSKLLAAALSLPSAAGSSQQQQSARCPFPLVLIPFHHTFFSSSSSLGAIIGGVAGGVVFVVLALFVAKKMCGRVSSRPLIDEDALPKQVEVNSVSGSSV